MRVDFVGEIPRRTFFAPEHRLYLRFTGRENSRNSFGYAAPLASFLRELSAAFGRQRIKARFAIVRRYAPRGFHPGLVLEALQGKIKRAVVHQKNIIGLLLDCAGDFLSVTRTQDESTQD